MKSNGARSIHRRTFLKLASAAGVGTLSPGALAAGGPRVCLIIDPENPAASSGPAKRAADHLARTLKEKNIPLDVARGMKPTEGASFCIALANSKSPLATGFPHGEPTNAESLRIAP